MNYRVTKLPNGKYIIELEEFRCGNREWIGYTTGNTKEEAISELNKSNLAQTIEFTEYKETK